MCTHLVIHEPSGLVIHELLCIDFFLMFTCTLVFQKKSLGEYNWGKTLQKSVLKHHNRKLILKFLQQVRTLYAGRGEVSGGSVRGPEHCYYPKSQTYLTWMGWKCCTHPHLDSSGLLLTMAPTSLTLRGWTGMA